MSEVREGEWHEEATHSMGRRRRKQNREAIAQLAAKGLAYDSGERRDGAIVWKLTPKGEERLRTEDSWDDRLPPEGEALLTAFKRIEAGDE